MPQKLSPEDEELLREEREQLTAYYRREALKMIRDAKDRKEKPYAYRDLANDLLQYGVDMDYRALINRLNREAFSFHLRLAGARRTGRYPHHDPATAAGAQIHLHAFLAHWFFIQYRAETQAGWGIPAGFTRQMSWSGQHVG